MSQLRAKRGGYESLSLAQIRALLREGRMQHADVNQRVRVRRQLVIRNTDKNLDNLTGTYLPAPFDQTLLAIRTVIGETAKAVQHYASRIAANTPKVSGEPLSTNHRITATVEKTIADQERVDMALWEEDGGRGEQWVMGMHMALGGGGYYLTLPRDADFGLPDRSFYDNETDEELNLLRDAGKVTPYRVMRPGNPKLVYAEPYDVWADRRKSSMRKRAESGRSLFTLEALPRDQVMVWRDKDGTKAAAVIREIPGTDCAPGESIPAYYAKTQQLEEYEVDEYGNKYHYGIWVDREGKIVGGIERGGPPDTSWQRPNSFTMIQFFNRTEQCVLISGIGSYDGAVEVFRGKHGCKKQGVPACPVVEVPAMRTGINVPGHEFTTPMEPVFAYAPIINQLMTILSNASAYNGLVRWVVELKDGSTLRGEDGEPQIVENQTVPGLDPSQAAAYPGTLKQLLINTESLEHLLKIYMERLDACLPSPVTQGQSGSSAAAWQVRQLIQQSQETLRQLVDNHAQAVKDIIQMWHGWMRDLDLPVYFFPAPGERSDRKTMRSLIEFDPRDFTDAITVVQDLDTPDEATVLLQQGIELHQSGFIDDEEFYEKYAREQDVRDAVKRKYKRQILEYIWTGAEPPLPPGAVPGQFPSMVRIIGDGVRGRIFYQLIQQAPHFADQYSSDMAAQAGAQMQAMQGGPGMGTPQSPGGGDGQTAAEGGGVADAAGMTVPGMGQNSTLQGQLGSNIPSGVAPPTPVAT